jgi:S1-C subfamily serine protease
VDINARLGYQDISSGGAGLVLSPSGDVLVTNDLIRDATSIRAADLGNGHSYTASVVGYDVAADLALLHLNDASRLATVALGSTEALKVGTPIVALAGAGPVNAPSWAGAPGKVTALNRSITVYDRITNADQRLTGLIETSDQGLVMYSGGALAGSSGKVIGLLTLSSASTGYSIPIDAALPIVGRIENGPASPDVHRGPTALLGVLVLDSEELTAGHVRGIVRVLGVIASSPAARAGLAKGDVLIALNGRPLTSVSELTAALLQERPGATVPVTWDDELGHLHSAIVTLASGPPD